MGLRSTSQAERDRTQRDINDAYLKACRERDELRAAVEALLVLNQDLRGEIERLQRENGALARTYALAEKLLRARTEALNEMLESFTEPEDDNDILRRARAALC